MNVSAILVTRGDVDLRPVVDSLPSEWEVLIWDNSGVLTRCDPEGKDLVFTAHIPDLSVYGRYAAIEHATHDLIYVQDDDVVLDNPSELADVWAWEHRDRGHNDFLVANMPPEFRHDGYTDSCLVGFGACFHRDAPTRAWSRMYPSGFTKTDPWFERTCDVVFTTLTPRVLVDVPKTDREMASDPNRMWKQPDHYGERTRMLELARQVRDA